MTPVERDYLEHVWAWGRLAGQVGAREVAKWYAEHDHYRFSRLPELLEEALQAHNAKKEVSTT